MPSMKVVVSPRLGTGPVQWPPGSPGSRDQGSGFHTRGPGRSGYPPGRAAGEPGLVIVSLIRSLKAPRRAGGAVTSSADTSCYCGGGETVSLHSPDAFNMPPAR